MHLKRPSPHLLLWALNRLPVVVLDMLKLVKLHTDVINGELQQVPEPSQVLRGGSRHGTGVLVEEQGQEKENGFSCTSS